MACRMSDLLEQLRKAVGESNVLVGRAVHDDYTHDETLTARAGRAAGRSCCPARPDEVVRGAAAGQRAPGTRHRPWQRHRALGRRAIPVADGILLAFDRMNRIREIDTENQVAVVEPGVTLEQLNAALAPLGLIYPVSPGEQSASLGGNVGTNAGGMRAVRYGVTRHHVLGLEVVLADGRVLRTGGKFVKCSTRLRPDPAAHRLGGHAGRHDRGDGQGAAPARPTSATVLVPFATSPR